MSFVGKQARQLFHRLPAAAQQRLRPVINAFRPAASRAVEIQPLPEPETQADELARLFRHLYNVEPSSSHLETLAHLAGATAGLSQRQRQRRILAAFDQQVLNSGSVIRWDASDIEIAQVEGLRVHLDRADVSVSRPIAQGQYESHMIAFFRRHLREGMRVVDAGANIGLYSLLAARLVGPAGKVWAFEPNSENCRLLLASAADNGLANIALEPVALGNTRGHIYFTAALGSNGAIVPQSKQDVLHPSCRVVPMAMLDDFALERVDLIKMDVEGAEGLLVEGAALTLQRCRPVVTAEFSNEMLSRISGQSGGQFLRFFRERGYSVCMVDKATHAEIPVADTDAFAREFEDTVRIEDLVMYPRP